MVRVGADGAYCGEGFCTSFCKRARGTRKERKAAKELLYDKGRKIRISGELARTGEKIIRQGRKIRCHQDFLQIFLQDFILKKAKKGIERKECDQLEGRGL